MEMGLPCVILRSGSDTVRAAEWTGCEEGRDSSHAMLLWDDYLYPTRSSSLNATPLRWQRRSRRSLRVLYLMGLLTLKPTSTCSAATAQRIADIKSRQ